MSAPAHPAPTGETRLWHPFAPMGAVKEAEFVVARGDDVWVWDATGRRYLDATASLWYANAGHGRREIADAIAAQLAKIEAYSNFGDIATEPTITLARRLSDLSPMSDARVFFGSGGGDGVETALKLARLYWDELGQPERTHVVSGPHAYHGTHGFGSSVGGIPANRAGFGQLVPDTSGTDAFSVDALRDHFDRVGSDRVAAFIFEPVPGAGGVYPPPPGYVEGVAELCRESGILLIVDSTICAFGRLGTWFGIERFDVVPDMIVFAKGVTSGYLPLGGVVIADRVAEPFWQDGARAFRNGVTYSGHATCCAAAHAALDLLERDDLLRRGETLEDDLLAALAPLADHPLVAEVRGGTGLLAAVELAPDVVAAAPDASPQLVMAVREHGVLVRSLGTAVAVSPPLTVTGNQIVKIGEAITSGLDDLQRLISSVSATATT